MAAKAKQLGPTSRRVAANVRRLRDDRRLTTAELSKRLEKLGCPIPATGITKLERAEDDETARRVDVDDLMALAIALDVTPNRLLLPADANDGHVGLTAKIGLRAKDAWRWATGEQRLGPLWNQPTGPGADQAYRAENRPHDPAPATLSLEKLVEHRVKLNSVAGAVRDAQASGLSLEEITQFVRMGITVAAAGSATATGTANNASVKTTSA